jgi:hypothetical protein
MKRYSPEEIAEIEADFARYDTPADFWPDEVMVVGKYKSSELAFLVAKDHDGEIIEQSLKAMRDALWISATLAEKK